MYRNITQGKHLSLFSPLLPIQPWPRPLSWKRGVKKRERDERRQMKRAMSFSLYGDDSVWECRLWSGPNLFVKSACEKWRGRGATLQTSSTASSKSMVPSVRMVANSSSPAEAMPCRTTPTGSYSLFFFLQTKWKYKQYFSFEIIIFNLRLIQ